MSLSIAPCTVYRTSERARAYNGNTPHSTRKLNALSLVIFTSLPSLVLAEVTKADTQMKGFNTSVLQGVQSEVDLQLLLSANSVLPGNYRVDLYSNELLVGRRDIEFSHNQQTGRVEPCLTLEILEQLGIDMDKLQAKKQLDKAETCHDLSALINQASLRYDASRMHLYVSIPQVAMKRGMRGYVDPKLWDAGVSAAFVNYQLNTSRSASDAETRIANILGLRNGINLGGWRLRNESNFSSGTGRQNTFRSNRSYLQHDVTKLKGQFSAGDIFTDSDLFDSVRYRGVKLASDEGMRADGERGYAPIVRGVAQTSATVEIRQNNYVLYTTNVPPGPFEINDIYPSGSNGDLEITIIEADGRRRVSMQAFSSLPLMVRRGQIKYSLSAGRYRRYNRKGLDTPPLLSTTLSYGLSHTLTGVLGLQATDNYRALAVGTGLNTLLGAFSLDVTHTSSKAHGVTTQGNSLRALYAKTFTGTDTNFTLAAYRYSTEGFRSLTNHIEDLSTDEIMRSGNSKTRTDLTINQSLGRNREFGSLYLTATDQRYWNRAGSQSLSAGYTNNWGDLSYNFAISHTKDLGHSGPSTNDTQFNLSMSLPLGSRVRAPRAFVTTSTQKGNATTQVGINGYLSETSDTFYSIQGGHNRAGGSSASANLSTRTSIADIGLGYSQGSGYDSQNLNIAGAMVAHPGGINLGQTLSETFALAEVPGIKGAKISNYSGVETGRNGYAVIPNAQPYRVNWISLDTRDLGGDTEIDNATQQLVPRRGAVVLARYIGKSGRRVQFELFDEHGQLLPFGASVEDEEGRQLAITDPSGRALVLLEQDQGSLSLKWGERQCTASYRLPKRDRAVNYERLRLACQP